MQTSLASAAHPEAGSRPGLTSLVRTGRGLMTVQTEIVGAPAQLVTIVDFRGRVLKTWRSPFSVELDSEELGDVARRWHADIEARVRESLAQAAARARRPEQHEVVSHLYLAAARAYAQRDFETARAVLSVCELLMPDDPRIRQALRWVDVKK